VSSTKQLWVLAGGNGAGKSTFYQRSLLAKRGVLFLNADMIAKSISEEYPETVSYDAANVAGKIREEFLSQGISFCFETVFSHPSKIDFLANAKAHGYRVVLVYIHLDTIELNQARVSQRVAEGGHNVPPDKIKSRLPRTRQHIATALRIVDEAWLLDNSSKAQPFRQIALVNKGKRAKTIDPLPSWAEEMLQQIP
jgi:predicted ABC-type ATPase